LPVFGVAHRHQHQAQNVSETLIFEQPLNERIRTFLRVEQLIQRFDHFIEGDTLWDTHGALRTLIELADLISRVDLKSELMKELKRQIANLEGLDKIPGVNTEHLRSIVDSHRALIDKLHDIAGNPGAQLKTNQFLRSIEQRAAIPGGTCDFDLPSFHHWLSRDTPQRRHDLELWIQPYRKIHLAVAAIMDLVRESAGLKTVRAEKGFFEKTLDPAHPNQLIRIGVDMAAPQFPEVSAGKHRFSIRFLVQPDLEDRPIQITDDFEFELACCAL
jgi:cell division protein ZapD